MDNEQFLEKAKTLVWNYAREHLDKSDRTTLAYQDVYVVWFCKTLQNWKALVNTNLSNGMYYEVTYNGDKQETYLDAYWKFQNIAVPD